MDSIYTIAKSINITGYEDLPSEVVEVTKKLIMDTLAAGLCGSTGGGIKELREIFKGWGGKKESTVWVYGDKFPCVSAAQVNAAMSHAWDYDDTFDPNPIHTGATAIPTALAIAEIVDGIDGKKVIAAVAMGVEFAVRLCKACKMSLLDSGWHYTALHGNFIAAAVAGKLLGLDEEKLVDTFGIVYHQAGGNIQCIHDGALTKRMGPGFAVRNGIMAAFMAQKGITGAKNVLEGRHGLFNVYHQGEYYPEVITENLGKKYEMLGLSFKPYPCCRDSHSAIDATLRIISEYKIKPGDVDTVTVTINTGVFGFLCDPLNIKRNPRTIVDAQFSIPWVVALAIVQRKVDADGFTQSAIQDETILRLSNKVEAKIDESMDAVFVTPAIVEIKTKDGRVYSHRVDDIYGSPQNPMGMEATAEKFRDCASRGVMVVKKEKLEKLIKSLYRFETVRDIKGVISLLNWS